MLTVVNPRHVLHHPSKPRRYEFVVVAVGRVRVRKFEFSHADFADRLVEQREVDRQEAARLWRFLRREHRYMDLDLKAAIDDAEELREMLRPGYLLPSDLELLDPDPCEEYEELCSSDGTVLERRPVRR